MRILLAGYGSIGKRHARVLRELGVRQLTAYDPDASKLEELKAQQPGIEICESFSAGLERQPDAVFILTPPKLHVPMAIQALEAGCLVFSEKPISDTLDGIDALSALARDTGRKVMVGLCFRFHEGLRKAKELACKGLIGRLVSIRSLVGEHLPDVRADYKTLFSSQYSGAFDLMHDIDLALWFAQQPVRRVKGIFWPLQRLRDRGSRRGGDVDRFSGSVHGDGPSRFLSATAPPTDRVDRRGGNNLCRIRAMGRIHAIHLLRGGWRVGVFERQDAT